MSLAPIKDQLRIIGFFNQQRTLDRKTRPFISNKSIITQTQ